MTQTTINKQAQSPLTERDRIIIANIIQRHPEEIKTIWIDCGITVWVQLTDGGRLPFERNWFAARVAEEKTSLDAQEKLRNRNQELEAELKQACKEHGLNYGQIDYLFFSTKVYQGHDLLGIIGFHRFSQMWTYRHRQRGVDQYASSVKDALAKLGVRQLALV